MTIVETMNRLASSTSPYLRQHADNPVDWWEWSRRGVRRGPAPRRPGPAVGRLRRLPLVPRHGARVVRGRAGRRAAERALRQHQGRPRGAAGHRRGLHGRDDRADRARRLADDLPARRPTARRSSPARTSRARSSSRCSRAVRRGVARRPGRGAGGRAAGRRRAARACGAARRRTPPLPTRGRPRRRGRGSWRTHVRPRARRLRPGAEVPAVDGAGVPAAPPRAHRRRRRRWRWPSATFEAMARGGMYDQLGGGFARYSVDAGVGRAALREDALRQRAAAARLPALAPAHRRRRSPSGSRARPPTSCCATCAPPRAASRRRSTPTPTASRG